MIFHISLAFTAASSSVSGSGAKLCDESMAQTKHWALIISSSTRAGTIDLKTPDREIFLFREVNLERHVIRDQVLYNKFQVARYKGVAIELSVTVLFSWE
jgi:hypothetical protein